MDWAVPIAVYSWDVHVVTHEFGHLLGSEHTHACVWNGNNTAIDGCESVEGSCTQPPLPPTRTGTIMSYCHQNVGINFNLGFGPQPGNVIRNRVSNASCLSYFITGPDVIGASCQATYTISNLPPGATYVRWEVGAGISIVSSNSSSCTVQRTISINDPQYAEVRYVYTYSSQQFIVSKNLVARIAPVFGWTTPASGSGYSYYLTAEIPLNQRSFVLNYEWEVTLSYGSTLLYYGETTSMPVDFTSPGTYPVRLRIRDGCEWSKWISFSVNIY